MEDVNFLGIAKNTFRTIENTFPHLKFNYDFKDKNVDINVDIPKQSGLEFDVNLNLQTDELHLSAKHFWGSWFTIKNPEVVRLYTEAVLGLITGKYRIVQYWNNDSLVKSILQKPINNDWETVFTDRKKLSFPWARLTVKVIQNHP